ncbi:hypothetical protein N0B31_10030 [Salinirubellus salinus]|uniref:Uncharacterized protein n=1 Tax=Salinirubellus salinus TaxID=1364945 RepID=A0A9E7UCU4_9EURY|nr:hypothetical protein [Salinirubellus salinus]UWM56613.1 hypothetical protein N0B31_10030 [Salinirubellus salinus]
MSTPSLDSEQYESTREEVTATLKSVGRSLFGDRLGLTLFLASVLLFALWWATAVRINDNYTIANTLVALLDGQLHLESAPYFQHFYGPEDRFNTPGMHLVDGKLYGRNYGQLFFALPFAAAFRGIFTVFDPRLAVAGLWSLGLLALAYTVGTQVERPDLFTVAGSVLALAAFGLNVALATDLDPTNAALMGLQLSTMVAAAFVGVLGYRLVAELYDRRLGLAAGVTLVLASPVAYWADLPKRHTVTALFVMCALYTLYRSRTADSDTEAFRFRALSYVWPGLMAWTHAPEGALLLFAVGVADFGTRGLRGLDVRQTAMLGGVVLCSLVPFLLTNYAISGNPVLPPRFLPDYGPAVSSLVGTSADGAGGAGGAAAGNAAATAAASNGPGLFSIARSAAFRVAEGLLRPLTDPTSVYQTFVRSGYIDGVSVNNGAQAIDLSVLESMPLLGAFVAAPVVVGRYVRRSGTSLRASLDRPVAVLDVFALVYTLGMLALYLPSLPIHAQVTVRYLHPIYVLGLYAVVRLPAVRRIVAERGRLLTWTFLASVFVGGQLLLAGLVLVDASVGESAQAHALLNLATAGLVAAVVLGLTVLDSDDPRALAAGAISLGLAAAATAAFVLLSRLYHVTSGEFLLPLVPVF